MWGTTHASSEDNKDDVEALLDRSPSGRVPKRPPYGITEELKLPTVEKVFRVALLYNENIWEFIEVELGQEVPPGAHKPRGLPPGARP